MKIVLFGDSLFAQFGKHRVKKLEEKVTGSDVYNCAVGGWDSNDCASKAPYIVNLKPDVLVISLGTNDASPWKQVDLGTFKTNLPRIIDTFSGSKFIYFLPPPVDETKETDDRKILNSTLKLYYDAAKEICGNKGALVVNSWDIFKPILDKGEEYHVEDGVHLEENAYDILIAELAKLLNTEASTT